MDEFGNADIIGVNSADLQLHLNFDEFNRVTSALNRLAKYEDANEARPLDEWHQDMGDVLWWTIPIKEAPYCGTPYDYNFPGYCTHWTQHILPG